MAIGDYTKVSGIKGYDKLRKIAHEGGGSDFGGIFKKFRDKKKKKLDSKKDQVVDPNIEPTTEQATEQTTEQTTDQTPDKTEDKKESFKERRARRKEEGKWYLGKYADKFKDLIRTEPPSDEPAFTSTLKPLGTIVKERQELKDKERSETFAKNQQMAEDRDAKIAERLRLLQDQRDSEKESKKAKKSVRDIDSDGDGIPDTIDVDTKPAPQLGPEEEGSPNPAMYAKIKRDEEKAKKAETFAKNQAMAKERDEKIKERLWQMQYDKDEAKAQKQYYKDLEAKKKEDDRLSTGVSEELETPAQKQLRLYKLQQQKAKEEELNRVSEEIPEDEMVSEEPYNPNLEWNFGPVEDMDNTEIDSRIEELVKLLKDSDIPEAQEALDRLIEEKRKRNVNSDSRNPYERDDDRGM